MGPVSAGMPTTALLVGEVVAWAELALLCALELLVAAAYWEEGALGLLVEAAYWEEGGALGLLVEAASWEEEGALGLLVEAASWEEEGAFVDAAACSVVEAIVVDEAAASPQVVCVAAEVVEN